MLLKHFQSVKDVKPPKSEFVFCAATGMISFLRHPISGFQVKEKYWDSQFHFTSVWEWLAERVSVRSKQGKRDSNREGKERKGEGDRHVRDVSRLMCGAWWDMNSCELGQIPLFGSLWDMILLNLREPCMTLWCCRDEFRETFIKPVCRVYKILWFELTAYCMPEAEVELFCKMSWEDQITPFQEAIVFRHQVLNSYENRKCTVD